MLYTRGHLRITGCHGSGAPVHRRWWNLCKWGGASGTGSPAGEPGSQECPGVSGCLGRDDPGTPPRPTKRRMVELSNPMAAGSAREGFAPSREESDGPPCRGLEEIVGGSRAMQSLFREIRTVADADVTVLVEGETGTGKNLIAETIHSLSPRADEPFVALNASNLQEQLLESELFGHVKGAFSGAHQDHAGLARAADGGTLFIDEVGELSASNQARLLQFLDSKTARPVGSTRSYTVDARIVAATNRCLQDAVRQGQFREDLYYRLHVIHLRVPPLRERPEDLPLLIDHFLRKFSALHDRAIAGLSNEARALLLAHPWSGNVRELENELERAVIMTPPGETIGALVLSEEVRSTGVQAPGDGMGLREYRRQAERRVILATLRRHGWNVSAAARELGFSRVGLTKKLKRLGIERPGGES
ncbi:MAG: sigma-54 interaction domain-containing protein [Thermoanaerobaculia bacterium]